MKSSSSSVSIRRKVGPAPLSFVVGYFVMLTQGLGYIDLSKRRVSPEDIVRCEERYNKSKIVHSILRHVAEKTQTPIERLYETIGWPLNRKYGHSLDAFKLSITYVFGLGATWARALTDRVLCAATLTSGPISHSPAKLSSKSSSRTLEGSSLRSRQRSVPISRLLASATRASTPSRPLFGPLKLATPPRLKSSAG